MCVRLKMLLILCFNCLMRFTKRSPSPWALELGKRGEQLAVSYLKKKNFRILARNWKRLHLEIDIIGYEGDVLVFVEVRARSLEALVPGYYSIGFRKKRNLRKACYSYLKNMHLKPKYYRFDVVEVRFSSHNKQGPIINHYENVPLF